MHHARIIIPPAAMTRTIRPDLFAIHPEAKPIVQHVGHGHHKIVIVDEFYRYPDEVLQTALDLPYTDRFEIVGNFPGVRASLNVDTQSLIHTLADYWGCPLFPFFSPQPVVFQGIKMHQYRLNVGQRRPHIDQDITALMKEYRTALRKQAGFTIARVLLIPVLALLLAQLTLGVQNILLHLPLINAVAHNGMGALLLAAVLWLLYRSTIRPGG